MKEVTENILEIKAQRMLDEYEGANNYILNLKRKSKEFNYFKLTRAQAEYIISFYDVVPKVAKKWVELDSYFSQKLMNDKLLTKPPKTIYVEKLLVEKDKSYHIWGKLFENDKLSDIWLPKVAILKEQKKERQVEIDYSKYEHRPPLSHQKVAIEKLVGNDKFILADDMGLGKFLTNNTLIYTPLGTKKMGEIVVGDKVIGSNGKECNVIGVFPQGKKETYKITFNDGYSIMSGDEHLWSVSSPNYGKNRKNVRIKKSLVLSTKQMYEGGKIIINGDGYNKDKKYEIETHYKSPNGNNKWQIPIVKSIQFESNGDLPINPYLLGLGLGDGSFKGKNIKFSVHKDDYDELFNSFNLKENKPQGNKRIGYVNVGDNLFDLGLEHTRSSNKFIPDVYKYTTVENRLSILQGLMDTDGHCMLSKNGSFMGTEYSTISEQLCDDVCEIVQTLGGIARKKSRHSFYKKDGKRVECSISYRVNIKLPPGMNPFRLKRKADRYNEPIKYPTGRYIKKIEKIGEDYCTCISVDSSDKLYVAEHCIVTHNTTSTIIAALETGVKKVLIVCPASLKINWQREIQNYSDRTTSIIEGKNWESSDFVIVNYDILKNFHECKKKDTVLMNENFDLAIIDECFTYDSKIMTEYGEMMIGDIVEKCIDVKILTYNLQTKNIEYKNIDRWIRKNKDIIYQIKLQNGVFIECTDNHKFYTENRGYVKARELTKDDKLYLLSESINQKTNLEKESVLFEELCFKNNEQIKTKKRIREKVYERMFTMWKNDVFYNRNLHEQKENMFEKLFFKNKNEQPISETKKKRDDRKKWWMVGTHEKSSQRKSTNGKKYIEKNEREKPNVQPRKFRKNEKKYERKNFLIKRWERTINRTTKIITSIIGKWLGDGITNQNKESKTFIQKFTKRISSGYWKQKIKNIGRNRWPDTQVKEMEVFRQKKNESIKFIGVESIEILERGSYDKSQGLFKKNTRVYDLEIRDNHNYFINNILVSNCHYISNTTAKRTKLINDILGRIPKVWLLSGTPMTSRPINYYNLLNLVDSPVAHNWMAYAIRYCEGYQFSVGNKKVWKVTGASNLEELRERTKPLVLRRLKEDVLDLPEKIITPVYLRLKSKEYENLMGEYYDWYEKSEESKSLTVQFSKLMKVRQVIAQEKVKNTIELAENILEQGKKVIIFTNFTETLNTIASHFGKSAVKLDGSMSKIQRQYSVDQFQENEKVTVFVGNLKAAGVGITLTSAEVVIMNDLSFVPSDHAQGEDRAYRYGQKNNVLVYYPLFENTIEGIIYDILNHKKQVFETVMGDNEGKGDVMEEILNRISKR